MQVLALALGTGVAQVLVAGLYVLTARSMRPDQYGPVVTAIGLGLAFAGFSDLGANGYWIRELASQRMARSELDVRASVRFLVVAVISGVIVCIAFAMAPIYVATGVLLFTSATVQALLVPLRADRRAESVGWLIALGRVVSIVVFLCQISAGVGSGLALWTSLAVGDIALMACAIVATPKSSRIRFKSRPIVNPWSGAGWYMMNAASTSATQLDLPILGALAGPAAAGVYGGVNRWTQPLVIAIGAFSSASAPIIAAEARIAELRGQLLRASWILIIAIGLSGAVFATAPWLVTTLLGDEFADAASVLRILAVAMAFNAITQPMLVALQSRGLDHLAALIVTFAISVQLLTVVVLARKLGALSAGIGVLVTQVIALIATSVCIAVLARRRSARVRDVVRE